MNIQFENEVLSYLNLPKLPAKEWDGVSAFDKGVAVVKLAFDEHAYAVATFNPETMEKPSVIKSFAPETFYGIEKVLVVPAYMDVDNIENADLDEESKRKAAELANEAAEIENDGTDNGGSKLPTDKPYYFDNINNDEEARAFIEAYNKKNKIGGRIPTNHDTILMRLAVIYSDLQKASGIDDNQQAQKPENTESEHNDEAPLDDTQEPANGEGDGNGAGEGDAEQHTDTNDENNCEGGTTIDNEQPADNENQEENQGE